jgi:hypothetical protein
MHKRYNKLLEGVGRMIKEIRKYKWQVIITLILSASIFICYKFIDKPDKPIDNPSTYLISIVLGLIAFSIPFLWNAYQRILDIKDKTKGDRIEDILTKEFYQKSLKYFKYFIQYPVGILIFFGLFVVPLLTFYLGWPALVLIFLYFLMLPQIFDKIERSSTTNLKNFLASANAESEDTRKVFAELWQKEDDLFEKEFSIEPFHVFEYFSDKVDSLIEQDKPTLIQPLIKDFGDFLKNRSIIFLTVYETIPSKILEWYFKAWKREYEYSNKADVSKKCANYNIKRMLNSIIKSTEKRVLKGNISFSFFECFKKHVEEYKEEKIEDKNKRTHRYIESLFHIFYQVFFENIKDAPEKYEIWEYYFPKEWKITKGNLEDKDNYIISRISWNLFLQWAYPRIQQPTADYDETLENAIKNLFPEVDPIVWSRILLFVYTPHDPGNRIKSVIEREWNFGFSGRGYVGFIGDKKEFEKEFNEYIQQQERNAFELALFLFVKQFDKENLKRYIEELKELESKYDDDSKEEGHRLRLLDILEKMLNSINK